MTGRITIEALRPDHDRKGFSCGVEVLDRYLRELASQDVRRRVSNCFVAVASDGKVVAFYTFSAASLPLTDLPDEDVKRLPRYGVLPAGLIGRLAVDESIRGQGIGGLLLIDAAKRSALADPAIFALIVDAKDEAAIGFYGRFGFRRFSSRPISLYLPMATAIKAIQVAEGG